MAPIPNELWLAAALTSTVPAALAQSAPDANRPRTGVATTVTTNAARGASSTTMYIDGTAGQRLATDANSTLHVLFSDQSAVTLGPNSELIIAKYEFDPKTKNGQILIDMTKGLLRVVGGLISKKTATLVRTSTATIGIRGGISTVAVNSDQTDAIFLFGIEMTVADKTSDSNGGGGDGASSSDGAGDTNSADNTGSGQSGQSNPGGLLPSPGQPLFIRRPGFQFTIALNNGRPTISTVPPGLLLNQQGQFSGGNTGNTLQSNNPNASSRQRLIDTTRITSFSSTRTNESSANTGFRTGSGGGSAANPAQNLSDVLAGKSPQNAS